MNQVSAKTENRTRIHIMITIFVMVFIFVQSALPGEVSGAESNFIVQWIAAVCNADAEVLSFWVRKMAHFTEYMILGACLIVNVRDYIYSRKKLHQHVLRLIIPAWLIGTAYAATDEFHQRFVADRSCEFRDVCIDAAGVLTGILIARAVISKRGIEQQSEIT